MKNKILSLTIFWIITFSIISAGHSLEKKTIIVDDEGDGDYTSIQKAVTHARDGDIILVYSGEYNEEVIISDKSITIEGIAHELGMGNDTGKPVITVEKEKFGIFIQSDNCTVKNMKIIGKDGYGWAGIGIRKGNYNRIINNDISKMIYWGIEVVGNFNYIFGNNISYAFGGGVQINKCGNIVVSNKISNCRDRGIQISSGSKNTTIRRNIVEYCNPGIMVYGATNTKIIENNFSCNEVGIAVVNSLFTIVSHNNIIDNTYSAGISDAHICIWYENYWNDWHIPLPKPIIGEIGIIFSIPWVQFDWHPLMQPYEWWKE